jgi:hypothetical protein
MVLRGQIQNGVVVFEGQVPLPEGTQVEVKPVETPADSPSEDAFYDIGKLAVPTGIPDLAQNIDHYLYGHPKQDEVK